MSLLPGHSVVSYNIKWFTTSWTHSIYYKDRCSYTNKKTNLRHKACYKGSRKKTLFLVAWPGKGLATKKTKKNVFIKL